MVDPTPENSTVDGSMWGECLAWGDLDWSGKKFRKRSIWSALGDGPDPHWRVPHVDGETFHRVRLKEPKA